MPKFDTYKKLSPTSRYTVISDPVVGDCYTHIAEMELTSPPAVGDPELVPKVLLKSINYESQSPRTEETYEQYVQRRRRALRHELEMLAIYHELTSHVPQVLDVVEAPNNWDPTVAACGGDIARNEPILVLERIDAFALGDVARAWSESEVIAFLDRMIRLLRVFHANDARNGDSRFFLSLSPIDILIDRRTRDCYIHNLSQLKTKEEHLQEGLTCEPGLQAYVSPTIAGLLLNSANRSSVRDASVSARCDLYSLAVIAYYLLMGGPDLTAARPGYLTADEIDRLAAERGLREEFRDFLKTLARRGFKSAQQVHETFLEISGGTRLGHIEPDQNPLPTDTSPVGNNARFQIPDEPLSEGGQGRVYVGVDATTGSRVIVKIPILANCENDAQKRLLIQQAQNEVEACVRMRNRASGTPQLIDVLSIDDKDAPAGMKTPVMIAEYIPGRDLNDYYHRKRQRREQDLLELLYAVSLLTGQVNRSDAKGDYQLYMDWKPENIRLHEESGSVTLLDLGAVDWVRGGIFHGKSVASTPPFASPEVEDDEQWSRINETSDTYGVCAVFYFLAARLVDTDRSRMAAEIADGKGPLDVFDMKVFTQNKDNIQELIPILKKGLSPKQADRYQDAEELAETALIALKRVLGAPIEPPLDVRAEVDTHARVQGDVLLAHDRFCRAVRIYRDVKPLRTSGTKLVFETEIDPMDPVGAIAWANELDSAAQEEAALFYTAFAVGCDGELSKPMSVEVQVLTPPSNVRVERGVESLRITWNTPTIVTKKGGAVVLNRVAPDPSLLHKGHGDHHPDDGLSPSQEYEYEIFSQTPWGDSAVHKFKERPLPKLSELREIHLKPGDSSIRLEWAMTRRAAHRLVVHRAMEQTSADAIRRDVTDSLDAKQATLPTLTFQMDSNFRVTGLQSAPKGTECRLHNGLVTGVYVDEDVRPGATYFYTPVLVYEYQEQGKARRRLQILGAESTVAYAEARAFGAMPLPGAVRLQWDMPERCDGAKLAKLDDKGNAIQEWEVDPLWTTLLDAALDDERPLIYRLQCRFGSAWSEGTTLPPTAPLKPEPVLPDWHSEESTGLENLSPTAAWNGDALTVRWNEVDGSPALVFATPENGWYGIAPAFLGEATWDYPSRSPRELVIRAIDPDGRLSRTKRTIALPEPALHDAQ